MEELRLAAAAYYNNLPSDLPSHAWDVFQKMDTDGDKAVSFAELNAYLQQYCGFTNWVDYRLFVELDQDRDGRLDFFEAFTLLYILRVWDLWCKNCSSCLMGLYFTCGDCFDSHGDMTYDLCPNCYCAQSFQHPHKRFVDNCTLVREMKKTRRPVADPNQAIVPVASAAANAPARRPMNLSEKLQAWQLGLTVATLFANCSIM